MKLIDHVQTYLSMELNIKNRQLATVHGTECCGSDLTNRYESRMQANHSTLCLQINQFPYSPPSTNLLADVTIGLSCTVLSVCHMPPMMTSCQWSMMIYVNFSCTTKQCTHMHSHFISPKLAVLLISVLFCSYPQIWESIIFELMTSS